MIFVNQITKANLTPCFTDYGFRFHSFLLEKIVTNAQKFRVGSGMCGKKDTFVLGKTVTNAQKFRVGHDRTQ